MNSKFLKNLQDKKYRQESGMFIVQGEKTVLELLDSDYEIDQIFCTPEFAKQRKKQLTGMRLIVVESTELETLGTFQANASVLAVVKQKKISFNPTTFLENLAQAKKGTFVLVLDTISDPGNLGTIIRIADWYGISDIIASPTTTDVYNPKAIAASMGSFTRVAVHYTALEKFLAEAQEKNITVIGAALHGEKVHDFAPLNPALVVMGSESNGISFALNRFISNQVTIPKYGQAESLNVGVATAIMLDNLKRTQ